MLSRKLIQYVAAVVWVGAVICFVIALRKIQTAQAIFAEAELEHQRARQALQQHKAEAEKLRAPQPALSNAEVLELARLRSEVTRLRSEQRAAALTNSGAARRPPAPAPTPSPSPVQPVTKLTSTVSAQVPLGHALALGGWAGPEPGQRIVGFITPATDASSPGAVLLETRLVSLPDRLLDRLGLQDLRTDQAGSQSTAGLDPARLAALLKLAEQEAGVSILSSPRVLTANGQAATVSVTQTQPDGAHTGPVMKLIPTLDATGTSVRLDVGLELNLPAKP